MRVTLPMEGTEFHLFSESFEVPKYMVPFKVGKTNWKTKLEIIALESFKYFKKKLAPNHGFSLILTTDLPMSAGLSSSAAVEVATAMAFYNLPIKRSPRMNSLTFADRQKMILLDYHVESLIENFYIWETNQVVQIGWQEEYSTHPLPSDTRLWIFDTGIALDLVDSHYGTRHKECTEALKILKLSNPKIQTLAECQSEILVDSNLPKKIMKRASHVVDEQKRVLKFIDELDKSITL